MPSGNADAPTLARLEADGPLLGRAPIDVEAVALVYHELLNIVAPGWENDPHMEATPDRAAKFWRDFIDFDPGKVATAFPIGEVKVDQLVAVTGIKAWSLCAHHLLPFSATVDVGYIADGKVLGLSKFARLAHLAAHRPTSQEALVETLANLITEATGARDVAVKASGTHLCMTMRGVAEQDASMTTSVLRGAFRKDPSVREEWLALVSR